MEATFVSRLSVSDFRNYERLSLDLGPGAVVLTGENGAGKTNLLEAVSLLSPGRGLRGAAYAEVARQGSAGGFAVHARIDTPHGAHEVGTGTFAAGEGGRRVRIDGSEARSSEQLLDLLRVVWITPAMDGLFTGPAGDRRRFLDRMVLAIDPAHAQRTIAYEKAMRGRNRLLSEGSQDDRWFDAIELQMAESGVAIAAARGQLVRLLATMLERLPEGGPFPRAQLALEGEVQAALDELPAVDVEEWLRRALRDGRARDRAAGRTLDGPHRSDLAVRHPAKDMPAAYCSTGEQKALLIGIVLSHARLTAEASGKTPVLLLDEVAAHLDPARRRALFSILGQLGAQTFMTGADASLFAEVDAPARFFTVADGKVQERR